MRHTHGGHPSVLCELVAALTPLRFVPARSHSVGLTGLTNEQIVAELRWSQQIIKDQTGVTPLYTRAPWGDVDDRVRAVMKACGLTPIVSFSTRGQRDSSCPS